VLTKTNKVIIDNKGASAPIILPPDVFRPRAAPQPSSATATPALPQRVSGGTQ
jgi:membrane protease subunit HflK